MLWALGSASCDIRLETADKICYVHWVLRRVISHTRQEVRFATGISFCVLWYLTRDRRYDLLYVLDPGSCDITHETGPTICYGHGSLPFLISNTGQGVHFLRGIRFCVL